MCVCVCVLKPRPYFKILGLGFKTEELLKINDICNAIPQKWNYSAIAGTFQQVDPTHFDLTLNISGQKVNLQFKNLRKYMKLWWKIYSCLMFYTLRTIIVVMIIRTKK